MAETYHLWLVVALLLAAVWWTKHWLMTRLVSRWRYAIAGGVSTLIWIIVGFASTRYIATSTGVEHVYQSMAVAYFSAFMALVSVIGILLGLLTWTEEEGAEMASELPDSLQTDLGD